MTSIISHQLRQLNTVQGRRLLTSSGNWQYSYGDDTRLTQAMFGGIVVRYWYDGVGQRIAKQGAALHYYAYDEAGQTIGEYAADSPVEETVYLGDLPVVVLTPSVNYVFADHLNAPRVLEDDSGNVTWSWLDTNPFGAGAATASAFVIVYNHRFPGQIYDVETGLHYNYSRDYDPNTGRYIQSDPIGMGGGINTYAYVLDNPISHTDPYGLQVAAVAPPPPIAATPSQPANGETGEFRGPQYFWPKAVRDAASAIADACTGGNDDQCKDLNQRVQAAKDKVGKNSPAACRPGMSKWDLLQRRQAWLDLASARAHRDQKCWEGGDSGHQQAQASAWSHVGNCDNLLKQ